MVYTLIQFLDGSTGYQVYDNDTNQVKVIDMLGSDVFVTAYTALDAPLPDNLPAVVF